MRKLISTIFSILALTAAGVCSVSCIWGGGFDDIDNNNGSGGGHRYPTGGDQGGGSTHPGTDPGTDPGTGDNKSIFPGDKLYQIKADAVYYGDTNYDGVDEYVVYFYWGEYDEDGSFKSEGTEIAFDLLCKQTGDMHIPTGTYNCTSDDFTPGHFLDGYEQDGYIYPSYAYFQKSKNDSKTVRITSGNMTLGRSGEKYQVKVYFATSQTPDSSSKGSYLLQYEGEIPVSDGRESGGGDSGVEKTVEMKDISRVEIQNWGQIWQDNDGKTLPVSDWILYLYGPNADKDNEYAMIELLAPVGAKAIETGIYNEVIALGDPSLFKAGAVLAGYTEGEDNIAYGTWYCKDGVAYYAASKGSLTVTIKDDLYALTFDFVDEDETYGGAFKGTYMGAVEYVDKTATKAGESRGMKQRMIRRRPVRACVAGRSIAE